MKIKAKKKKTEKENRNFCWKNSVWWNDKTGKKLILPEKEKRFFYKWQILIDNSTWSWSGSNKTMRELLKLHLSAFCPVCIYLNMVIVYNLFCHANLNANKRNLFSFNHRRELFFTSIFKADSYPQKSDSLTFLGLIFSISLK